MSFEQRHKCNKSTIDDRNFHFLTHAKEIKDAHSRMLNLLNETLRGVGFREYDANTLKLGVELLDELEEKMAHYQAYLAACQDEYRKLWQYQINKQTRLNGHIKILEGNSISRPQSGEMLYDYWARMGRPQHEHYPNKVFFKRHINNVRCRWFVYFEDVRPVVAREDRRAYLELENDNE